MSTMATLMLLTGCGAADTGKTPDKNTGKTSVSAADQLRDSDIHPGQALHD
jgi:hypothetical protein